MKREFRVEEQKQKIDKLFADCKQWKSKLGFAQDEIHFMERLLNSYVFEPNTPNLFERLQIYLKHVEKAKTQIATVLNQIAKHQNELGGMIECQDEQCDMTYYKRHDEIKARVTDCIFQFQEAKAEIFNYAGGILKKRKSPLSNGGQN